MRKKVKVIDIESDSVKETYENSEETSEEQNIPEYGDQNWEKYVMSQFLPEELYNEEYPTLHGMRRISLNLLGKPDFSGPVVVHSDLPNSSYCIYELKIGDMIIRSAADGHQGNIGNSYSIYPTAIAESRAEARVYRKALMISKVSAEEIKGNESSFNSVLIVKTEDNRESEPISEQQRNIIKEKCKQIGIKEEKLYKHLGIDYAKATRTDGATIAKTISQYQQSDNVPVEVK